MTPYFERNGITIFNADCRDVLPTLGPVDHVITDPPYGISGLQEHEEITRVGQGSPLKMQFGDWDMEWNPAELVCHSARLLRPGGTFLSFFAYQWWSQFQHPDLVEKKVGIWVKANPPPRIRPGYQSATEFWLWKVRAGGSPVWNGGFTQPNVVTFPICAGDERSDHPTQKPLGLIKGFVARHTDPGETILDPFAGSGTTGRAAMDLGRKAILIEMEEKWCEVAAKRMEQQVLL